MTVKFQSTMKTEELSYFGNDPGAVKLGNFINYYTFHAANERIDNLHTQMFPSHVGEPVICLDVGCNSGELTKEFYQYLTETYPDKTIKILAVDIDTALIERAKENINNENITYMALDIAKQEDQIHIRQYLNSFGVVKFDISFCFSVTMWIHLNNGDEGLLNFLRFVKDVSTTTIIESQPWKCYRNAQRRLKKQGSDFSHYHTLKIRSNVTDEIERIMTDATHKKIYESSDTSWRRKIQSFQIV